MAKASILVMVRPMLANRKGFTLVEMIFVLAITVIISSITLAFRKPKASAQAQIALVTHAFQLARSQAMVKHETVKVVCDSNRVEISSNQFEKEVVLANDYQFLNHYQFTFNASGHIKIAKTIRLSSPGRIYEFVFQLGSGVFYVQ